MTNLEFHPLAERLPLVKGGEYDELVASIKVNGLREPITLYEGKILDGRNRYRACLAAGIEPVTTDFQGDDPVAFVCDKNLHRRHLTAGQKAMIMVEFAKLKPGYVATQKEDGPHRCGPVLSAEEAAKIAGVSTRTLEDAKVVLANGTPQEIADVTNGHASAKATARKIRKRRYAGRPRCRVPDGYSSVIEAARVAVDLEREGKLDKNILPKQTYHVARDIILLLEMHDALSVADNDLVQKALRLINEEGRVSECVELIRPLATKVWGPKGQRFTYAKRVEAFCNSLSYVQTTCNASAGVDIPYLSKLQRREAIANIAEALASLRQLHRRLKGQIK